MSGVKIHPTAIVDPQARLGAGVTVGPYSIIERGVTLGENVEIGAHAVITGQTNIGRDCKIFSGAVIGSIPQDKKFGGQDDVGLVIGEKNVFREFVTVNMGTVEGGGRTIIGNGNFIMAYAHVAHDCRIGDGCIIANAGTLAGHVTLEDRVVLGGLAAVHQFVRLGKLSIIGGCSKVVQDIPPFSTCDGHPAKVFGLNLVGLKRSDMSKETMHTLRKAFKILFHSGLSRSNALEQVTKELPSCPELDHLLNFVKTSERGISGS